MDSDYEAYKLRAMSAPRLTSLLPHFEAIALGETQVPSRTPTADISFLNRSPSLEAYHDAFQANLGTFYKHLCASIPYIIEEHTRLGTAILEVARLTHSTSHPLTYYETSAADGTQARTIGQLGQGAVVTLTDTPNPANVLTFRRCLRHTHSHIHQGPFVDIEPLNLSRIHSTFSEGFDVVYENTTFQMYGPDRASQVPYVARLLKPSGILICLEKVWATDPLIYQKMEETKDALYKSRYFDAQAIESKRIEILETMETGQVSLADLVDTLKESFTEVWTIWQCGNFVELAASNDKYGLQQLVERLVEPHVPPQFRNSDDSPVLRRH